jgi:SAM-dependent methyltransferase
MQPKEDEYIYTDGVDYAETSDDSIWGTEETITAKLLGQTNMAGAWLNLCAGDGRFNNHLLARADSVTAADIDESALEKLARITPQNLKSKLIVKVVNVVEPLPFMNSTFNGIFCSGTLHLFPREIFKKIVIEMDRVLKADGQIIIDFATDIKRIYPDGSLWIVENEPNYSLDEARTLLQDSFPGYELQTEVGVSEPEDVTLNDRTYTFSCNFILLKARKV